MQTSNDLSYELQNVLGQLRRARSIGHGHSRLKGAEKHILLLIAEMKNSEPVTTSEIANKIGVTLSAVTHQINGLEKEGLVNRLQDKDDRRIVFIELSRKGASQVTKLKVEFADKIKKLSDFLGEKDTRSLIRIIKKLSKYPAFSKEGKSDA